MIRPLAHAGLWPWVVMAYLGPFVSPSQAITLVEQGQPRAAIVLSRAAWAYRSPVPDKRGRGRQAEDPIADEHRAAVELQTYVEQITGARLPIVTPGEVPAGSVPIMLGEAAEPALLAKVARQGEDPAAFILQVTPSRVAVRGLSPQGTYCGVCELLEQWGVRWFMPGPLGTVVPNTATLAVEEQETVQVPSFASRYLQGVGADEWEKRLRAGGPRFPSAHGIHLGERADKLFAQHPEYFALREGKRSTSQLCVSHPEVLRLAIASTKEFFRANPAAEWIGMGPNDGRGFCECDKCRELDGGDYDPFGHCVSMTDRYIWFFNQVLQGIEDEFPDKRIGFYAYASYNRPPVKVRPDPRIVPAVAMITLCRLHGMDNPVCPEKRYEEWILRQWGQLVPEVYYRGYWFNLADPGLPFFMLRRIAREVPLCKELHVAGWRTECMTNWAGSCPSLYLAHKLMWNHRADAGALLSDFYHRFFGPAAEPMRRYIEGMDATLSQADYHTGSIWDMASVYHQAVRQQARAALDQAQRAVPADSLYGRRVAMYCRSFDFLEGFADVMEGRARHDYPRAKAGLERMIAARDELLASQPGLITKKCAEYMRRFFAPAILEAYERTTGFNRLLAPLSERWQFQIDPERVGEALRWWDPAVTGGSWQSLETCSRTWSGQGLRYYKVIALYRQSVVVPAEARGRRAILWIGAVDESARVWVNGKFLGASPKGAFQPFEMDASEAVLPGQPNVVAVCVANEVLNELGTGGIMGPAFFYLPPQDRGSSR